MSKYYLTNAIKNSTATAVAALTGSQPYSSSSYTYDNHEQWRTEFSPSGEYILRMGIAKTDSDTAFFSIHQSQSSIPGGFDFSHPTSSDSIVFTTPWEAAGSQQSLARPYGKWISDTEFAIGLHTNAQSLSGSNILSGAGWPSGDFTNAGGVFAILSGSGANWEVAFWNTGSYTSAPATDGATQPHKYVRADAIAINHRYTTTPTDRIAVYNSGIRNRSYMDAIVTVFAKISGSWGWHSQFQAAASTDRIDWLDKNQDHLGIIGAAGNLHIYAPSASAENSSLKYARVAYNTNSGYNHSSIVWDPYNNKCRITVENYIVTFNSSSAWLDKIGNSNAYLNFNNAYTPDEMVDVGTDTYSRYSQVNAGCDLEYWRFRSGSAAILYPQSLSTLGYARGLKFAESGSFGWHVPVSSGRLQWGFENAPGLELQGGDEIKRPLSYAGNDYDWSLLEVLTANGSWGMATPWFWHTEKGASGELIYTLEPYDTGQYARTTGRNIFYNLNTYNASGLEEFKQIASYGTGSTSYELSSSFDSLNWELVTAPQHDYLVSRIAGPRGGVFSPDGTYIAQATQYGGQAESLTQRYGIDLYKSGSSGWEWDRFLTSSHAAWPQSIAWASNGEIWTTYGWGQFVGDPQRWISSSATGWAATSSALIGTRTNGEEYDGANQNKTRYYNRILFNKNRTAAVLWSQQSNETISSGYNRAYFGIMISGSNGFSELVGYADPSYTEFYKNFQWISDATNDEQDYRLLAISDSRVEVYNVPTGSGIIRADQESGNGQQELLALTAPGGELWGNLWIYHSASDSIIYDYGLGVNTDDNVTLVARSVNPFGEDYDTTTNYARYVGYNRRFNTTEPFQLYDNNNAVNPSNSRNLHNKGLYASMDFLLRSSSANVGAFFVSTGSAAYYDRPAARFAQVKDPSTEDRFLYVAGYEASNAGMSLNVVEKGSDGWKRRELFDLTDNTTFYVEDNWTQNPNRLQFDISINGDLLIPATGSITGFQIARVSGMGTVADPALENASSTAITAASGGTVRAGGTQSTPRASVSIPAGALASDTTIGVDTSEAPVPGRIGLGQFGRESLSPLVRLTPHGTKFSSAVTVTFNLIGSGDGVCPANAQLWKRNGPNGSFYPVPSNLWSCTDGVVTLSTTSFSDYIIIGGQQVARTKINNVQLARLTSSNIVLPEAINITGSNESYITSVSATDAFILQSTSGFTAPISASAMAAYFSSASAAGSIDVTAISTDGTYSVLFTNGTTGATLSKDNDSLTFNPSTNALTTGILTASSDITGSAALLVGTSATVGNGLTVTAGGATVTAGGLTVSAGGANITGDVTASADLRTNSGQLITNQSILNIGVDGATSNALRVQSSNVNVSLSFDASSTSSGAFTVAGGVGIGQKLFVGSNISGSGDLQAGGSATVGTGLTVTAGGLTVTAGDSSVQKLTVAGDLVVQGTTTTVDSTNTLIQDPLLVLGSSSNGSASLGDRGILFHDADGSGTNQLFMWDNSAGNFTLGSTTISHTASGDFSITAGDLVLRDLTGSAAAFTGQVSASTFVGDGSGLSGVGASVANEAASGTDHFLTFVAATSSAASFLIESGSLKYNPSADKLFVPNLSASSNVEAGGTLDVAGIASFSTHISASGDLVMDTGNMVLPEFGTIGSVNDKDAMLFRSARIEISKAGEANSHTDAALTVAGGIGIGKGLYVSGSTTAVGAVSMSSTLGVTGIASFSTHISASGDLVMDTGNIIVPIGGTIGASNDTDAIQINSGRINLTKAGEANSHTDAALVVAGGIGIGKGLYVSGAAVTMPNLGDLAVSAGDATHFVLVQDSDDGIVKKESVGDLVSAITGSGIQAASGVLSITYRELVATTYQSGSILTSNALTASLTSGDDPVDGSLQVYLNGMLLVQSGSVEISSSAGGVAAIWDYIYTGSAGARQVIFLDAIDNDDVIQIKYIKK